MDGEAWQAIFHAVATNLSWTQLSNFHFTSFQRENEVQCFNLKARTP